MGPLARTQIVCFCIFQSELHQYRPVERSFWGEGHMQNQIDHLKSREHNINYIWGALLLQIYFKATHPVIEIYNSRRYVKRTSH